MKTTNKFKYAFVIIGYISLLSLSQHAKADVVSLVKINVDGHYVAKGILTTPPVTNIDKKLIQTFTLTCLLDSGVQADPVVNVYDQTGSVFGSVVWSLTRSDGNFTKIERAETFRSLAFANEDSNWNITVELSANDQPGYVQVPTSYKVDAQCVNHVTKAILPADLSRFKAN